MIIVCQKPGALWKMLCFLQSRGDMLGFQIVDQGEVDTCSPKSRAVRDVIGRFEIKE
jgi:hypothetical protein